VMLSALAIGTEANASQKVISHKPWSGDLIIRRRSQSYTKSCLWIVESNWAASVFNEHLVNSGCLSCLNAQEVLHIIYDHPLYRNSSGHWNATMEGLARNVVLTMFVEYDLMLYDKRTADYFK
jgi:hypothetical protein